MNNNITKLIELNQKGLLTDEDLAMAIKEINKANSAVTIEKLNDSILNIEQKIDELNKEYENADSVNKPILEKKFKALDAELNKLYEEKRKINKEDSIKVNRARSEQLRHNIEMRELQTLSDRQFEEDKEFLRKQRNMYGERTYTDDQLEVMSHFEAAKIVSSIKEGLANVEKDREEAKKGFGTSDNNDSTVNENNDLTKEEKETANKVEEKVQETKKEKFKKKVANIKTASANLWSKVKQHKGKVIGGLVVIGLAAATIAFGPGAIAAVGLGVAGAVGVHQIQKGAKGK